MEKETFNMQIMFKDECVAVFNLDGQTYKTTDIKVLNAERCPHLGLLTPTNLNIWLLKRSHYNLENITLNLFLQSVLDDININAPDEYKAKYLKYGLSITDYWWIKKDTDPTSYTEINPRQHMPLNYKSKELIGILEYTEDKPYSDKLWVREGDTFVLYKSLEIDTFLFELLSLEIAKLLNIPTERYIANIEKSYIKVWSSVNLDKEYYESFKFHTSFKGDTYVMNLYCDEVIAQYGNSVLKSYYRMRLLDAIVSNGDRHGENFGFNISLQDASDVALTPLFDFDMAFDSIFSGDDTLYELQKNLNDLKDKLDLEPIYDVLSSTANRNYLDCIMDSYYNIHGWSENLKDEINNYLDQVIIVLKNILDEMDEIDEVESF